MRKILPALFPTDPKCNIENCGDRHHEEVVPSRPRREAKENANEDCVFLVRLRDQAFKVQKEKRYPLCRYDGQMTAGMCKTIGTKSNDQPRQKSRSSIRP